MTQYSQNYEWCEDEESYLGGGGFGRVYKGKDRRDERVVAIKVFPDDSSEYLEDVELLKTLKSHYVTQYFADEEVISGHFARRAIVMELADGTLSSELKKKANLHGVPKRTFLVLIDNCVKALEYLHAKRVAHRDVKPQNVLIFRRKEEPSLVFKLCDFGFSQSLNAPNQSMHTVLGTPQYMPSLMIGRASDYEVSYTKDEFDLWSTSCCFFEAATGRIPFKPRDGCDIMVALLQLLTDRPPNTVCAEFNKETKIYDYHEVMPRQHKSYTRSFRNVLARYFQLLFNKDKAYLELEKFSFLCAELVNVKECAYYCLNTSTVESFCDTSSLVLGKPFVEEILEVVQMKPGCLNNTRISFASNKICEFLHDDETIEIRNPQADYTEPIIALLFQYQISQISPHSFCVATLRDIVDGVRLELQDKDCIKAVKKMDCTVEQLIGVQPIPLLGNYLHRCTNHTTDVEKRAKMLTLAIEEGDYDAAQTLLRAGVDANSRDSDGNTMLGLATSVGDLDLVRLLVWYGANVSLQRERLWCYRYTPLHYACEKGHYKIAVFLLDNGADVNARTKSGLTPLQSAAGAGKRDVVKLLINRQADITVIGYAEARIRPCFGTTCGTEL